MSIFTIGVALLIGLFLYMILGGRDMSHDHHDSGSHRDTGDHGSWGGDSGGGNSGGGGVQ